MLGRLAARVAAWLEERRTSGVSRRTRLWPSLGARWPVAALDGERATSLSYPFERYRHIFTWVVGGLALTVAGLGCTDDGDWRFGHRPRARGDNVKVVYDRDIDFSRYRTFAFRSADESSEGELDELEPARRRDLELVDERTAIELRELGLTQVAPEDADLLAFSLGRTRSATGVTWSCVGGVWGGYFWDYYYDPCAWLEPVYIDVDRTTLMLGLTDPELSEVIFTGFIRNVGAGRRSRARQIAAAVDRIFARYPARPGTSPDAGVPGVDAGVPELDAGPPSLDAGTPRLDGGASDAGAVSVDAGAGDAGPDATP